MKMGISAFGLVDSAHLKKPARQGDVVPQTTFFSGVFKLIFTCGNFPCAVHQTSSRACPGELKKVVKYCYSATLAAAVRCAKQRHII